VDLGAGNAGAPAALWPDREECAAEVIRCRGCGRLAECLARKPSTLGRRRSAATAPAERSGIDWVPGTADAPGSPSSSAVLNPPASRLTYAPASGWQMKFLCRHTSAEPPPQRRPLGVAVPKTHLANQNGDNSRSVPGLGTGVDVAHGGSVTGRFHSVPRRAIVPRAGSRDTPGSSSSWVRGDRTFETQEQNSMGNYGHALGAGLRPRGNVRPQVSGDSGDLRSVRVARSGDRPQHRPCHTRGGCPRHARFRSGPPRWAG
jgi:hypothetical protein